VCARQWLLGEATRALAVWTGVEDRHNQSDLHVILRGCVPGHGAPAGVDAAGHRENRSLRKCVHGILYSTSPIKTDWCRRVCTPSARPDAPERPPAGPPATRAEPGTRVIVMVFSINNNELAAAAEGSPA
jgi:hypothetical protein